MLIIFDLDDTLIDTHNCLTKPKLKEALKLAVANGYVLKTSFNTALKKLLILDKTNQNSKQALKLFFENEPLFFELTKQHVYFSKIDHHRLFPNPSVLKVLKTLSQEHTLAIVTMGDHTRQFGKIKKAGIDIGLFSKIVITDTNKKEAYRSLANEFNQPIENVVVCGDKFEVDLLPALELGCRTVQTTWGRVKNQDDNVKKAQFLIDDFEDLFEIINHLFKTNENESKKN